MSGKVLSKRGNHRRRRGRLGLTLIELLVIIGIIVLILAMIMPTIQRVRASMDQMLCANHLRQLTTAAHHFHADQGRLPPGYLGPSHDLNAQSPDFWYEGQWIGHFPLLLPYLEEKALFEQLDVNFDPMVVSARKWFWSAPANGPGPPHAANYTAAMKSIKVFRCPSAANYITPIGNPAWRGGGTILGMHVYQSAQGVETVAWKDEYGPAAAYRPLGRTHYAGVAGTGLGSHPELSRYEGIYTNRSKTSLGQLTVQDGTSHTLLYGEICGSWWASPPEMYELCWMAAGGMSTYLGLHRGLKAPLIAFSSYHVQGANFSFADGSVRMVRYRQTHQRNSEDWYVLQELAGKHDGGQRDTSALVLD